VVVNVDASSSTLVLSDQTSARQHCGCAGCGGSFKKFAATTHRKDLPDIEWNG
jgi:hypothetical protein